MATSTEVFYSCDFSIKYQEWRYYPHQQKINPSRQNGSVRVKVLRHSRRTNPGGGSFQVARSMWLLTIHRSFHRSPVLLLVAISGITCAQPTMFPTLKTSNGTAASAFLTCTNFKTGSKLPDFAVIVVSARANQ